MDDGKKRIIKALTEILDGIITEDKIESSLHKPKDISNGNLSFACHPLAKHYRKPPIAIAESIAQILDEKGFINEEIDGVEAAKGYLNFRYNPDYFVSSVLETVLLKKEEYGRNNIGDGKKVVIDFSAPNLGKPMHVGHIRSTILGDSVIKLLNFSGYKTYGINYLGDIGLHIGKLISAYNLWGDNNKLEDDPEKEMFNLYVRFGKESENDPSLEKKAKQALERIENGDPEYTALWDKIRDWSLEAFQRVYDLLDVNFDEITGQSFFSEKGKDIVKKALEQGIASYTETDIKKDDEENLEMEEGNNGGGVVVNFDDSKLPPKIVLRKDGTAIYSTQDLGAAVDRFNNHGFDKMLYVVATEQGLYFQQLFKIIDMMGYEWSEKCHHLGFGLINLEEGKMSTREGKVVLLEDVLGKSIKLAEKKVEDRDMPYEIKKDVARQIGIGSVKYMVLQVDPVRSITFSWEKALDFNGNSAPYIQYAYARASRILEKCSIEGCYTFDSQDLKLPQEIELVSRISDFQDVVQKATEGLKPNLVANYMYSLAKDFTAFYSAVKIRDSDEEKSRLALVEATRITMRNASNLLGIELPERM